MIYLKNEKAAVQMLENSEVATFKVANTFFEQSFFFFKFFLTYLSKNKNKRLSNPSYFHLL